MSPEFIYLIITGPHASFVQHLSFTTPWAPRATVLLGVYNFVIFLSYTREIKQNLFPSEWLILLNIMTSGSALIVTNGRISLLKLNNTPWSIRTTFSLSIDMRGVSTRQCRCLLEVVISISWGCMPRGEITGSYGKSILNSWRLCQHYWKASFFCISTSTLSFCQQHPDRNDGVTRHHFNLLFLDGYWN